jgi:DNA replication and repair protein RecF
MIIEYLELTDYRNYDEIHVDFSPNTNIFFGDNAQGKTNILESVYITGTTKSHRGSHDSEIISFGKDFGVIRALFKKNDVDYKIGIQLRREKRKAISINESPVKKAADLLGIVNVVLFSPEDLQIIKNGPDKRRRFIDMILCQVDKEYLFSLSGYNKIVDQRNKLLKSYTNGSDIKDTLEIWDEQLVRYGSDIIKKRKEFIEKLNNKIYPIHKNLTGSEDKIEIIYDNNVDENEYKERLKEKLEKDIRYKNTSIGPHRDDVIINIKDIDIKKYGSQGQQRTVALSLKLAEIEIIKEYTGDTPILLLDDVLSELDMNRQKYLLENLGDTQTIITCTGLDEFVNNRFEINKCFKVNKGSIQEVNNE